MKREAGAKRTARGGWPRCPLFAFPVSPKIKRIWNAGRRRGLTSAPVTVRRCPLNGRGQLAFRRSTTALPKGCVVPWCDPGQVSWANRRKRRGSLRRRSAHFQRRTSHAGRNAGRHDARTARERVASPPAGSASRPAAAVCLRGGVLYGRDDLCGYVTERGTIVKKDVPLIRTQWGSSLWPTSAASPACGGSG